jgi:hypothetical protein
LQIQTGLWIKISEGKMMDVKYKVYYNAYGNSYYRLRIYARCPLPLLAHEKKVSRIEEF